MFTYQINNIDNLIIDKEYNIIPIGHRCTSAIACKYANIRKFSLPFDWVLTLFPSKLKNVLLNDFSDFIPSYEHIVNKITKDKFRNILIEKYDFYLSHFNININIGIEQYTRRILRFNEIFHDNKKIFFIFINEDYLYNNEYRDEKFNNQIYSEIIDFENFIRSKYNFNNFNILYFDFKHHNIPSESNIINILINSKFYTENPNKFPIEKFRIYCGLILSKIFKSTFKHGISLQEYNL